MKPDRSSHFSAATGERGYHNIETSIAKYGGFVSLRLFMPGTPTYLLTDQLPRALGVFFRAASGAFISGTHRDDCHTIAEDKFNFYRPGQDRDTTITTLL